jgi:hypothetical protein
MDRRDITPIALSLTRRQLLALVGFSVLPIEGCLESPSSSPPPYETREIDDGPFYNPGLRDERSMDFFAGLVTSEVEAREFDLWELPLEGDRAFIESTDYETSYLGVVQVSGLNSSMSIWLVDLAATSEQLGLVLGIEDSDDRVITTYIVRVRKEQATPPERIWVQLSIGNRTENFSGS